MKTINVILLNLTICSLGLSMFGQAREASVNIDKENHNAVMISINRPKQIAEDALKSRLERSGLEDRIKNGEGIYKEVVFSEISPEKLDIYTKVEKASNNSSIVYIAVTKVYDDLGGGTSASLITDRLKTFLNSFVRDADNEYADVQISGQVKDLKTERKSYDRLLKDQKKLERQKKKIEKQLVAIQIEINAKKISLDSQKSDLKDAEENRENN